MRNKRRSRGGRGKKPATNGKKNVAESGKTTQVSENGRKNGVAVKSRGRPKKNFTHGRKKLKSNFPEAIAYYRIGFEGLLQKKDYHKIQFRLKQNCGEELFQHSREAIKDPTNCTSLSQLLTYIVKNTEQFKDEPDRSTDHFRCWFLSVYKLTGLFMLIGDNYSHQQEFQKAEVAYSLATMQCAPLIPLEEVDSYYTRAGLTVKRATNLLEWAAAEETYDDKQHAKGLKILEQAEQDCINAAELAKQIIFTSQNQKDRVEETTNDVVTCRINIMLQRKKPLPPAQIKHLLDYGNEICGSFYANTNVRTISLDELYDSVTRVADLIDEELEKGELEDESREDYISISAQLNQLSIEVAADKHNQESLESALSRLNEKSIPLCNKVKAIVHLARGQFAFDQEDLQSTRIHLSEALAYFHQEKLSIKAVNTIIVMLLCELADCDLNLINDHIGAIKEQFLSLLNDEKTQSNMAQEQYDFISDMIDMIHEFLLQAFHASSNPYYKDRCAETAAVVHETLEEMSAALAEQTERTDIATHQLIAITLCASKERDLVKLHFEVLDEESEESAEAENAKNKGEELDDEAADTDTNADQPPTKVLKHYARLPHEKLLDVAWTCYYAGDSQNCVENIIACEEMLTKQPFRYYEISLAECSVLRGYINFSICLNTYSYDTIVTYSSRCIRNICIAIECCQKMKLNKRTSAFFTANQQLYITLNNLKIQTHELLEYVNGHIEFVAKNIKLSDEKLENDPPEEEAVDDKNTLRSIQIPILKRTLTSLEKMQQDLYLIRRRLEQTRQQLFATDDNATTDQHYNLDNSEVYDTLVQLPKHQ